jgi:hypothetical protein
MIAKSCTFHCLHRISGKFQQLDWNSRVKSGHEVMNIRTHSPFHLNKGNFYLLYTNPSENGSGGPNSMSSWHALVMDASWSPPALPRPPRRTAASAAETPERDQGRRDAGDLPDTGHASAHHGRVAGRSSCRSCTWQLHLFFFLKRRQKLCLIH